MTTPDRPLSLARPGTQPPEPARPAAAEAGLDSDSVYSYGLDGFPAGQIDPSGASDPQETIDLESLAEQIYLLLRREAYLERERLGARR